MKISDLAPSIIAPLRVRRKRNEPKSPPWSARIPPDEIDVALKPRIRRYGRAPLKFNHHFGTTRTKYEQRLALYRDLNDEIPPGVPTPQEAYQALMRIYKERRTMNGDEEALKAIEEVMEGLEEVIEEIMEEDDSLDEEMWVEEEMGMDSFDDEDVSDLDLDQENSDDISDLGQVSFQQLVAQNFSQNKK